MTLREIELVLRKLIEAMERRCAGFPISYELELLTIETAKEQLEKIQSEIDALCYIKSKWFSVDDRLPPIDKPVLLLYESGGIIQDIIFSDYDEKSLSLFLKGNEITGPITHWIDIELPS